MSFLKNLFSENTNISCMRVLSTISLLSGVGIAFISMYQGIKIDVSAIIVFVSAAFGGKVLQKTQELRGSKK